MDYLYISYDAVSKFASSKYFQSAEYEQAASLCDLLKGISNEWRHNDIFFKLSTKKIGFLYTDKINKKEGLFFDFLQFKGFENASNDVIITIFQKILKYSVKYFEKLPLLMNEKTIDGKLTLVFPFPFQALKNVDKVYIDTNSSKQNRADQNYLTVFYYGSDASAKPSFTGLNKAVDELKEGDFPINKIQEKDTLDSFCVTEFETTSDFDTDLYIGLEKWSSVLTKKQRDFVFKDVISAERLEGPAGSGKTISMILRCVYLLEYAAKANQEYHIIFITHSIPTKDRIIELFCSNCSLSSSFLEIDTRPAQSILITTLFEWSAKNLGSSSIEDNEFLDKDAANSKESQLMFIREAFQKVKDEFWESFSIILSEDFKKFLEVTSDEQIDELFQYEISVLIKGRANASKEKYLELDRPKLALPIFSKEDKLFAYNVFEKYQLSLEQLGYFDSDDITLSALSQINTPIRRRRNQTEGYDVCFIDETHLFNFNELSLFHLLNKNSDSSKIVYAIDKSQSFYQVGFDESEINSLFEGSSKIRLSTVFRSSFDIINIAFNVLSSNSAIFTNFENPLDKYSDSFTREEEAKCVFPEYNLYDSDQKMIENTFKKIDWLSKEKKISYSKILIVSVTEELVEKINKFNYSRSPIVVQSRNDYNSVKKAINMQRPVLGLIDYVGGLEFDAVIIVGVDNGRVPPVGKFTPQYMKFSWHNKMYVAITRAKYSLMMMGNKINGVSSVMDSSIYNKLINTNWKD